MEASRSLTDEAFCDRILSQFPAPAVLYFIIFVLAAFLGNEILSRVPQTLHTPLMSGANAISGITVVGALIAAGMTGGSWATWLGFLALVVATINVVGGFLVTDRMLQMFARRKTPPSASERGAKTSVE